MDLYIVILPRDLLALMIEYFHVVIGLDRVGDVLMEPRVPPRGPRACLPRPHLLLGPDRRHKLYVLLDFGTLLQVALAAVGRSLVVQPAQHTEILA